MDYDVWIWIDFCDLAQIHYKWRIRSSPFQNNLTRDLLPYNLTHLYTGILDILPNSHKEDNSRENWLPGAFPNPIIWLYKSFNDGFCRWSQTESSTVLILVRSTTSSFSVVLGLSVIAVIFWSDGTIFSLAELYGVWSLLLPHRTK